MSDDDNEDFSVERCQVCGAVIYASECADMYNGIQPLRCGDMAYKQIISEFLDQIAFYLEHKKNKNDCYYTYWEEMNRKLEEKLK